MLKLCPRGWETSPFITFFFLHRLPRKLRVLLSNEAHTNKRAVAVKADRLWALNMQHAHDTVAVVAWDSDMEDNTVAAVRQHRDGVKPPGKPL